MYTYFLEKMEFFFLYRGHGDHDEVDGLEISHSEVDMLGLVLLVGAAKLLAQSMDNRQRRRRSQRRVCRMFVYT